MSRRKAQAGANAKPDYPWARLWDMESRTQTRPSNIATRRGPGRPPKPFPRNQVTVRLTEDDQDTVRELQRELQNRLPGLKVLPSQVHSLAVHFLKEGLERRPAGSTFPSWSTMVSDLISLLGEDGHAE